MSIQEVDTTFTAREIADVTTTWSFIRPNLADNGCDLFVDFFAKFPEYQRYFKVAAGVSLDRLRQCHALKTHAETVMLAVTALVDNLENSQSLQPLFTRVGGIHARHHVPPQPIMDFKTVFLHWLRQKLGARARPSAMGAWEKAMNVLLHSIFQGIKMEKTEGLAATSANTVATAASSGNSRAATPRKGAPGTQRSK